MTNKIVLTLRDVLPDKESLVKYRALCDNASEYMQYDDPEDDGIQELLNQYYEDCQELGIPEESADELLDSLQMARVFYLAQIEVSLEGVEVDVGEVDE